MNHRELSFSLFPLAGLHKPLFGAFGAQDVSPISDEPFAHQRVLAYGADEAVVVPVAVFERDESGSANAGDGSGARGAALGEEFAEAVGAVRLVVPRGETLPS